LCNRQVFRAGYSVLSKADVLRALDRASFAEGDIEVD